MSFKGTRRQREDKQIVMEEIVIRKDLYIVSPCVNLV